jgi:hypothetical protein
MVVISQYCGHRVTGLYVGAENVKRYFPKRIAAIELQLGHLYIECELAPDFWQDRPEISDPRLCLWLESKRLNGKGRPSPVSLAMIPTGENSFALGPVTLGQPAKAPRASASESPRRAAFVPQPVGGAAA